MDEIQYLSPQTVASLAKVKSPASFRSIVRALIENSIDAGASKIELGITYSLAGGKEQNGHEKLFIHDNGCGIKSRDIGKLCSFNATNKIKKIQDLKNSPYIGFKGCSLASISCLCSKLEIVSQAYDEKVGFHAAYLFSTYLPNETQQHTCTSGHETYVFLYNVFQNFQDSKIATIKKGEIIQIFKTIITEYSIQYPQITFCIWNNKMLTHQILSVNKSESLMKTIYEKSTPNHNFLLPFSIGTSSNKMATIICGNPAYQFNDTTVFAVFLNGRRIRVPWLKSTILDFFRRLKKGYNPFVIIIMSIPTELVPFEFLTKCNVNFPAHDDLLNSIIDRINQGFSSLQKSPDTPCFTREEYFNVYQRVTACQKKSPKTFIQTTAQANPSKPKFLQAKFIDIRNSKPVLQVNQMQQQSTQSQMMMAQQIQQQMQIQNFQNQTIAPKSIVTTIDMSNQINLNQLQQQKAVPSQPVRYI